MNIRDNLFISYLYKILSKSKEPRQFNNSITK